MLPIIFTILLTVTCLQSAEIPQRYYHETIGIPLAERIRQAELAIDFDGSRITGGSPAPAGAHPYLVGQFNHLIGGRTSVCGSSMLSNTKAITAAHCWFDGNLFAEQLTLVFGSTTLFTGGTRVVTSNVIMHQNYNSQTIENDIAISTFSWVPYSAFIQPIFLPSGSLMFNDFAGVWAMASGFGMTGDGIDHIIRPDQVQSHVSLRVITNPECRQTFGQFVFDSTLCTSGAEGGNICSSDSGGPLSIRNGNQPVLIGVVSYGSGLGCQAGRPAGYARVTSFVPWILARL